MIKDSHKKTIITCALPSPGHAIPMIRLANALSKAGHKVFYFSSSYDIPKYQDKYVNIQFIGFEDNLRQAQKITGPATLYMHEQWYEPMKTSIQNIKPDLIISDAYVLIPSLIAQELNIKLVINFPMSITSLKITGIPSLTNNFNLLGLTILKPNFIKFLVQNFVKAFSSIFKFPQYMLKHTTLVHGFYGFDQPLSLPPNFIPLGLTTHQQEHQELSSDVSQWLERKKAQRIRIVYVTFGSIIILTQKFINHLYQGLKKMDVAVIWSLKQGNIPQENQNFLVRPWLPQNTLLSNKQIKVVITHCGWGGVSQIICNQKAILAAPLFSDQLTNADLIVKNKIGLILRTSQSPIPPKQLDQPNFTHQQLKQKINKIFKDEQIVYNLKRLNKLSILEGGLKKGVQIIQQVMRSGDSHLISPIYRKIYDRDFFKTTGKGFVFGIIGLASYFIIKKYINKNDL